MIFLTIFHVFMVVVVFHYYHDNNFTRLLKLASGFFSARMY